MSKGPMTQGSPPTGTPGPADPGPSGPEAGAEPSAGLPPEASPGLEQAPADQIANRPAGRTAGRGQAELPAAELARARPKGADRALGAVLGATGGGIANLRLARLQGAPQNSPANPRAGLTTDAARRQAERRAQRAGLIEDDDDEDAGPPLAAARRAAAARRVTMESAGAEPVLPETPAPKAEMTPQDSTPPAAPPPPVVRPAAKLARARSRHWGLLVSFLLLVLAPVCVAAWYLWNEAEDQYASTVGFSVRREEASNPMDVLGGLTGLSASSSSDTDILYEFLKSQKLVADMDARLDLRTIWSRPEGDPVFTFNPEGSIEDLVDYWGRMVRTSYDGSTGLIEIRVLAFTPGEATTIAQAIFEESAKMINALSDIAREDAIRFAREDLQEAEEKLRAARAALTVFRVKNRMVDPASAIQTQAGILGALESQLTEALIEVDLLAESTQASDPRLRQANRRVEVIRDRIATERNKVGIGEEGDLGEAYAEVVADYERLSVDREFTERAYVAALAAYDTAQAEARRTSRYLAAHILPTTAEVARYPERGILLGMVALFLGLAWAIGALVVYSLRDRR